MGIKVNVTNFFVMEHLDIVLNVEFTQKLKKKKEDVHKNESKEFFLKSKDENLKIYIDPEKRQFIRNDYAIILPNKAQYEFEDPAGKAKFEDGKILIPKDDTDWELTIALPMQKEGKDLPTEETKDNVTIGDIEPGGGD